MFIASKDISTDLSSIDYNDLTKRSIISFYNKVVMISLFEFEVVFEITQRASLAMSV